MSKEVIIRARCDAASVSGCDDTDPTEVTFNGLVVDLCDEHRAQLFDPLAELVATHGVQADGQPQRRPGQMPCLVCGTHVANMSGHLANVHGASVGDVYGTKCPLCARNMASVQALGVHLARTEDPVHRALGSVAEAFDVAARTDPHGIVKERRAVARQMRAAA